MIFQGTFQFLTSCYSVKCIYILIYLHMFCSHGLRDSFSGDPSLEQKFALLKFRVLTLILPDPYSSGSQTPPGHGRHQAIVTSVMLSSTLLSTRSSKASPCVGPSITWTRTLSSTDARNLLDCLEPAVLLSQQISGWLKSPIRTRASEPNSSCS